jgi:hypothetical protein
MPVEVLGGGRDHLSREVTARVADRLLLGRQVKVHRTNRCT